MCPVAQASAVRVPFFLHFVLFVSAVGNKMFTCYFCSLNLLFKKSIIHLGVVSSCLPWSCKHAGSAQQLSSPALPRRALVPVRVASIIAAVPVMRAIPQGFCVCPLGSNHLPLISFLVHPVHFPHTFIWTQMPEYAYRHPYPPPITPTPQPRLSALSTSSLSPVSQF